MEKSIQELSRLSQRRLNTYLMSISVGCIALKGPLGYCWLLWKVLVDVKTFIWTWSVYKKAVRLFQNKIVSILFFFFLFLYFIYLFFGRLRWVFVAARGLSLVVASGGYSSLWCAGFSLQWLLLLWSTGSRCMGFSSCSTRAQQLWLACSRAQA